MINCLSRHIQIFVIGAFLCITAPFYGYARQPGRLEPDTYKYVERDSFLCLDVYKPAVPRADKAAVLMAFGGGFFSGERNNIHMRNWARALSEHGFTVISIDYRLGFRNREMVAANSKLFKVTDLFKYCIDIAVEDCAAAVAWVCSNAQMLDIDPSKLILTGSSAGAITVLQLDYYRANSLPEASALPADWKPAAVIPYSGGIMCKDRKLKYATDPAPTMLMHGKKDKIVTYKSIGLPFDEKMHGGKKVDKAMNRQDIPHWFIRFEDIGHEVANWLPGSIDLFCTFVNLTLAGRITTLDATMTDSDLQPAEWAQMSMLQLYGRRGPKK